MDEATIDLAPVFQVTAVVRRGWLRDKLVVVAIRAAHWDRKRLGNHWMGGLAIEQSSHAVEEGTILTVDVRASRRAEVGTLLSPTELQ